MSSPLEVSPYNSNAPKVKGGVWNEDVLPVVEWEAADQRVVLTEDLQDALGIDTPVLRWDRDKYEAVAQDHNRDLPVLRDVAHYLSSWAYSGEEANRPGNYRILFQDETGRWCAASLGPRHGGYAFITVFGGSKPKFLENRLGGLRDVVRREK